MTTAFSVNFDYRCPFARNANEHVVAALRAGAPWDVTFTGFSLDQAHTDEGDIPVWKNDDARKSLVPVAAGIVARDQFPDQFLEAHLALFSARHDKGGDLRDEAVVRTALASAAIDPDAVFAELADGWPFEQFRVEHERSVEEHAAFGVPTFVVGGHAAFARIMTRPKGDGEVARSTISRVLDLVGAHPELNEVKHTTISR